MRARRLAALAIVVPLSAVVPACRRAAKPAPAAQGSVAPAPAPAPMTADASPIAVAVDARAELMAILFRLAGAPEAARAYDTPYRRAVDEHFAPFADHAAVQGTFALRNQHGLGHDAPYAFALQLDPTTFEYRGPARGLPEGLDDRWQGLDLPKYGAEVAKFARESGLVVFLEGQGARLRRTEAPLREALAGAKVVPYFEAIFGATTRGSVHATPGLLTGPMAYGVHATRPDGAVERMQVMFLEDVDEEGAPRPTLRTREYLVHELGHAYVNPLVEANLARLTEAFGPIVARPAVAAAMRAQAYPDAKIVAQESIVRALQILWLRANADAASSARSLAEQQKLGFRWTEALVAALEEARARQGGKLGPDAIVATTREAIVAWDRAHPE
jgi:hypothetical protein